MTNIKLILTLILGIIIGSSFTKLFTRESKLDDGIASIKIEKPTSLQKEVAKVESNFQTKIDLLKINSEALNKKLSSNKIALAQAKNKNTILQTQVYDLIDNRNSIVDTSQMERGCETLEEKVIELIAENDFKDGLYESIDSTTKVELENKDAIISIKDSMYNALKNSFAVSINQQQILFNQNKMFVKKLKRQRLKSKLLTAGTLILAGAAANYIIHH